VAVDLGLSTRARNQPAALLLDDGHGVIWAREHDVTVAIQASGPSRSTSHAAQA